MTLSDLLTELRENILRDTSDQVAGASDYLWSDTTLVRYINEAQRRFARLTKCIRDNTTPEVCQFTTVTSQTLYQLEPHVLGVLSVRMTGDQADLARAGHSDLDTYRQPDTYFFDPSQLENMQPGKTVAWTTDEGVVQDGEGSFSAMQLRVYPAPTVEFAAIVGNMRVVRLPLVHLSVNNLQARPEIPEIHHMDMLDWAAYLALRHVDLDVAGGDAPQRALAFQQSFAAHVMEAQEVAKLKLFAPLQWGFGRNAWSWETY